MSVLEGRTAVVSGAARGIGRAHALALAKAGADVVVNDLGAALDGTGGSADPASAVVREIRAAGGRAVVNADDVSSEEGARGLIDAAVAEFGSIDIVVNNAGILRDAMVFNMTPEDFDAVVRVHLRSAFLTTHYAANIWRAKAKAGEPVDARIINTTSVAGLYGNIAQSNYGSAKAGIAAMTIINARELVRYGVTVNALSPGATTRMTEALLTEDVAATLDPEHVGKVVVWLASDAAKHVTGRIIHVAGATLSVPEGWTPGPTAEAPDGATPEQIGEILSGLVARARPNAELDGSIPDAGRS